MVILKRKKKEKRHIKIIKDSIILYDGEVIALPFKDDSIIAGSIEFYNDPEPCMIHRSAVMSRYYMQIENWLDDITLENHPTVPAKDIPQSLFELLDI